MEERIISYVIGFVGIIAMMSTWVLIQTYWKQTFSDQLTDDDVLAGRNSCGDCGCGTSCQKRYLKK